MEILIKLSQFLLSLSLLIVLHELGHFIPARLFKTRVEKFYLFFDPKFSLLKKKIGETEYGIGWIPLGGYVKISGMVDESMDTEQLALPPQPWEFRSKPAWQRLIIMLGGVTVNFILAFLIYIGLTYVYGDFYLNNDQLKDGVWVTNKVMEQAGIHTGDKILAVDGQTIDRFEPAVNEKILMGHVVTVERAGVKQDVKLPVNFIDKFISSDKESLLMIRAPFVVGGFSDDSANKDLLKTKDIMVSMDGQPTKYLDQVTAFAESHKGQTVPVTVLRDEKPVQATVKINGEGKLGIAMGALTEDNLERLGYYKFSREHYGFFESIPIGIQKGKERLAGYGKQLKAIFTPSTGAYKGVGGFKAIFDIFPKSWSWEAFWNITALLSIMLGVLNLLPIPALDGGHVLFLLYEIISRRKPSDKFMEYAQMAGFAILLCLVLYANGNDIYRAVFHK
jgi:regulator of sigma E protease